MIRLAIDPNIRVRGQQTLVGFEDVDVSSLHIGQEVEVYEPECGLTGPGRVADIDSRTELVYLAVDWSKCWIV